MNGLFPQLDEVFALTIGSHGQPRAALGNVTSVAITVLQNDSPFGELRFTTQSDNFLCK